MFRHVALRLHRKPAGLPSPVALRNGIPLHSSANRYLVPGIRMKHTMFSREEYQPLPFRNQTQLQDYYITEEMKARSIILSVPTTAIEKDVRQLLNDHGFDPDLVLMTYRWERLHFPTVPVVMPTVDDATRAVEKVNGARLFDSQVSVKLYGNRKTSSPNRPALKWGWYATSQPGIKNLRLRAPLMSPPVDVSRPIKEGRQLVVEKVPGRVNKVNGRDLKVEVYELFHSFDVEHLDLCKSPGKDRVKVTLPITFATAEQAESARTTYDNSTLPSGHRIRISYNTATKESLA